MSSTIKTAVLFLALTIFPVASSSAWSTGEQTKKLRLQFEGTPLVKAAKWMSQKTGLNLIVEDSLRNLQITIFSGAKVSQAEAIQAFWSALKTERLQVEKEANFYLITRARKPQTHSAKSNSPSINDAIQQLDENTWRVSAVALKNRVEKKTGVMMQSRIVPYFKDGKAEGFKLFAIRPNSLYQHLGLRNGDIVCKINGKTIDSPQRALELYANLKQHKTIKVEIIRNEKPRTFSYQIE